MLKISNRYEKMAPEQLKEALRGFHGLDDRALEVVWKVARIFIQNCLAAQGLLKGLRDLSVTDRGV